MIHVVDAIMGSGKTSAAIQYMNEHPDKRYLYITPFIDETVRIRDACPDLNFQLPRDEIGGRHLRKSEHFCELIEAGCNVATTHALYTKSDAATARKIAGQGYVIIIDEVMDVVSSFSLTHSDYKVLMDAGRLSRDDIGADATYERIEPINTDDELGCGWYAAILAVIRNRNCAIHRDSEARWSTYFWALHRELFSEANDVFILTYLFDGMPMKAFLDMNQIPYRYMGAGKDADGVYRFTESPVWPDYVWTLKEKIHICDDKALNRIGDRRTALSASWTKSAARDGGERINQLRRNINTFFRNRCPRGGGAKSRLWCTYKNAIPFVKDNGFTNRHLAWNSRATNDYRDCTALAYCVNVFLSPEIVNDFRVHGIAIDEDRYALANMVQWIYRGAIRKGEEIWLYVPSKRMRTLLVNWIDELQKGDDQNE